MAEFNMSKLWLGRDGNYRDLNGNIIAKKGQPITGAAWRYLASKYGRDYANRTSMNTRNGNIFQNGHWRFNDVKSSREGRTATWDEASSRLDENAKVAGAIKTKYGYTQINPFTGKATYVNQDAKNRAIAAQTKITPSNKEDDSFSWGDWLNPFKKEQWEGNWDNATENAKNSWSNAFYGNWVNAYNRAKDNFDSSKGGSFWKGAGDLGSNLMGTISRSGLDLLGGTIGFGTQVLLPKKWEQGVGNIGAYIDPGKDLNMLRSLLTPGEETIWAHDANNKGFADERFNWLDSIGLDKNKRQDINDEANLAIAIFGTKGAASGVTKLGSGVKNMATNGVKNTIKTNRSAIAKHIPVAANIQRGANAVKQLRQGLAPKRWGGTSGIKSRTFNTVGGAFNTSLALMPDAALWPYTNIGFIMNQGYN